MNESPGWRRLKAHPEFAAMVERTLMEQRKAIEEVRARPTQPRPAQRKDYPEPQGEVTVHRVNITRAAGLGWLAKCSCGWSAGGIDKRQVECLAATHDI